MVEDAFYEDFGRRIAARRRAIDMTQAEVAASVGISRAAVANIEGGRQRIYLHQVYRFATALRLDDLSELLTLAVPQIDEPRSDLGQDLSDVQRAQVESLLRTAIASAKPTRRRG